MVGELTPNGFSGCSIAPSKASFYTALQKNCDRGQVLETTTCLENVVGASKGMLPVKYTCSNKSSICVILFFFIHMTVTTLR